MSISLGLSNLIASDTTLIALLLPLLILLIFSRLSPFSSPLALDLALVNPLTYLKSFLPHRSYPLLSFNRAFLSYSAFLPLSDQERKTMERAYAGLRANKQLGWGVGYGKKLGRLGECGEGNWGVVRGILGVAVGADGGTGEGVDGGVDGGADGGAGYEGQVRALGRDVGYVLDYDEDDKAGASKVRNSKSNSKSKSASEAEAEWTKRLRTLSQANLARLDIKSSDLSRVREALKHFIRDWSAEGAREREKIHRHMFEVLERVGVGERKGTRVLVPGCGLGRLGWEVKKMGFDTTANELSYFMILAFRFLLSPSATTRANQHVIHPYAHWWSHQRTSASTFRGVAFPDEVPRLDAGFKLVEGDFMGLGVPPPHSPSPSSPPLTISSSPHNDKKPTKEKQKAKPDVPGYDYILTLFFIDTSLDIFATLRQIYRLLKPGGTWVNLGPLLWTSGGVAKVELSLEEVVAVCEEVGFVFERVDGGGGEDGRRGGGNKEAEAYGDFGEGKGELGGKGLKGKTRTVECEYTGDRNAMMRWIYRAEFWVARKPVK